MSAKHEYVRGEERSGTEGTEPIAAIKKREWEWEVGKRERKKEGEEGKRERGKKREEVGKKRERKKERVGKRERGSGKKRERE